MNYDIVALGDVCEFLDSQRVPITESDRKPGPYPYYGANGQQDSIDSYIFDEPLVLLAEDGGYFGSKDRPIAYKVTGKCWVNNHAHVLRPKSNIDVDYLHRVLSYYDVTKYVNGTTRQKLTKGNAENISFPLPPLTEQKRIASLLRRADRLRQLRRTAHDLSDSVLQPVFLEMFGDPFRNEKGWERIEVGELIRSGDTINYGVVQPGDDFPNGKPVIRVGDLENLSKDITSLKLIDPKIEANYRRSRIVGDEILVACVGSIGRIALVNEKMRGFNIVRAVARVPADYSLVNRLYLAAYLSMPIIQDFFQKETRTVAQPTLNITQIEETPILMPPLSLQEEFAGVVRRVESLRGRMSEAGRQVEGLFKSLLVEAFG